MTSIPLPRPSAVPDWDALYRHSTPPWEAGKPHAELIRVLEEGVVRPGTVLELGCGTGADAVCLAKRGFEITAVDCSPLAIERCRVRAERESALVRFVLDDIFEFCRGVGPFDFVYDAGFYHFIRQTELDRFLDLLWRVTRPGSRYLTLAGSATETAQGGPPQVSAAEVRGELGRVFEVVHVRPCRLEGPNRRGGYAGWSCLMHRPILAR